ncbi:MAG: NAD(P)H-hydrate dehydratase, partial [Pelistega sp.]|nr:NAD(P)H-hydrate dehydratase [Pelistega sp.]
VYAFDNDTLYTNHSGNPGLATAGSGDVLSGVIGALCAQGIDNWQATCAGVWLHGAAADYLASQIGGEIGLLSSELPHAVRYIRNRAIQQRK